MSGHLMRRALLSLRGRGKKSAMRNFSLSFIVCLPLVGGCNSGEQGKSAAPPSPPGRADAAPRPAGIAKRERDAEAEQEPAKADETVPEPPFDLSYLDPATELFIHARPAAIVGSPFVQALTGGNLGPIEQLKESIGLEIDQIDTVTVGVRNLEALAQQNQLQVGAPSPGIPPAPLRGGTLGMPAAPLTDAMDDTMVVVRLVESTNAEKLGLEQKGGDGAPSRTHQSKTYYQVAINGLNQRNLYIADEKTLIIAEEPSIRRIIDEGEAITSPQVDLSFISVVPEFVLAVVPKDREKLFSAAPPLAIPGMIDGGPGPLSPGPQTGKGETGSLSLSSGDDDRRDRKRGNLKGKEADEAEERERLRRAQSTAAASPAVDPDVQELHSLLETHAMAFAVLLKVDANLKLDVAFRCDSPQSTAKIKAMIAKAVNSAVQGYETAKAGLPGVVQQVADAVLATVDTTSAGETVTFTLTLPESQQTNLKMLPLAVMGMMMGSGPGEMEALVDWQARAREVLDRGQSPAASEELPSNLQLRALARQGVPTSSEADGAVPLEIAIVATGDLASRAIAYGQLELKEINASDGHRLKWLGAAQAEDGSAPTSGFATIERDGFFSRHPDGGIATGYTFAAIGEPPLAIKSIAGSLIIKAAENVQDITVSPLPAFGSAIENETLSALGFQVQSDSAGGFTTVNVSHQNDPSIGAVEVIGPDGLPLSPMGSSRGATSEHVQRSFQFQGNIDRSQLGLKVTVFEDVQETLVAFRFEDLTVSGDDPHGRKPLVTWTPGEWVETEEMEGLLVDARARWNGPRSGGGFGPAGGQLAASPMSGLNPLSGAPGSQLQLGGGARDVGGFRSGVRIADDDGESGLVEDEKGRPRRSRGRSGKGRDDEDRGFQASFPATGAAMSAGAVSVNPNGMLQIAIDLTGPAASSITSISDLAIETADTGLGGQLEFRGGSYGGFAIGDGWLDIDGQIAASADQPPDGVRILALFAPPDPPIDIISQLRGTLMVRSAREQIEAVVSNLNERTDRRIKDRHLGKFGIEIAVLIEDNRLLFRMLEGEEERIAEMFPVNRDGERIAGVSHSTTTDNGNLIHVFEFPGSVPSGVGLKFSMNLGVEEIEVPLRFDNLPVPPLPETLATPANTEPNQFNGNGLPGQPGGRPTDGFPGRGTSATES